MKVILLQDVAKIGKRSEVVEVPDGYALNQLIPKRMAEPATAANQKRIEKMQADSAAAAASSAEQFTAAAEKLAATTLQIAAEVNEQGHTFQAVHEADIVEAAAAAGIGITAEMVAIATPIKAVGEHTVSLVQGDQTKPFTIEVIKKS